jgi:hypothetical protein
MVRLGAGRAEMSIPNRLLLHGGCQPDFAGDNRLNAKTFF